MAQREKKRERVSTWDQLKSYVVAPNTFDNPNAQQEYLDQVEERKAQQEKEREAQERMKRQQGQKARKGLGY